MKCGHLLNVVPLNAGCRLRYALESDRSFYVIGDRSEDSCRTLWAAIPESYQHAHSYSDFWAAYQTVFPKETHRSVGKDSGQTNHVKRWHNTLRQ